MERGEIAEALGRAQIGHRILEGDDGSRALVSAYGWDGEPDPRMFSNDVVQPAAGFGKASLFR